MGKLNMFAISFANLQGVYYAGQVVQGHVTIELTDTMKMRGVHFYIEGKADVHWSERHSSGTGKNRTTTTRHYRASELYFNQTILLAGRFKSQPGEDIQLPTGRHTFPFSFQLPLQLPSSFEGEHGNVRYTCKGVIDKPWKFDHSTKRLFTVISMLDLNTHPTAANYVQGSNTKMLCCLCCASGPISAVVTLDRQGYVPGEAIAIKAEIDNKSNRKMKSTSVNITMTTKFHATSKTRTTSRRLAEISHGPIEEGGNDYWNGDLLVVPPVPPSFLAGCRIIDIEYILEMRVHPKGGLDLVVPVHVIFGTIPLHSVLNANPPIAQPAGNFMITPMPGQAYPPPGGAAAYPPGGAAAYPPGEALPPPAPVYPPEMPSDMHNLPPPSYAECVLGKVDTKGEDDNEYTRGETNFAPVYTYYDWGHHPSILPTAPPNNK